MILYGEVFIVSDVRVKKSAAFPDKLNKIGENGTVHFVNPRPKEKTVVANNPGGEKSSTTNRLYQICFPVAIGKCFGLTYMCLSGMLQER